MSDRPIDELPVKSAAQLALTDFLIGHGDGAPAAFRSELDEVLDFLGPTLVSRFSDDIVGEVVERGSDANGEYVRFADGTQLCWGRASEVPAASSTTHVYDSIAFPAAFIAAPRVALAGIEPSGGRIQHGAAVRYVYRNTVTTSALRIIALSRSGETFTNADALETDWSAAGRWK